MKYISTRNKLNKVSGAAAIVGGLSEEGGLFVPETFPLLTLEEIGELCEMDYAARANVIISKFLPELEGSLEDSVSKAYAKFEDGDPAPLVKLDDNMFMLELWHGPTFAFKDIALTLLPYLMVESKKLLGNKEHTLVLVATSGDTGKAALEGFKDVDTTSIAVLYPEDGVSNLQKLQMTTTTGANVLVSGIKGNFDDAQTAVKKIFTNSDFKEELLAKNIKLSSANSINWGRLVPQIVYYFSAYADMVSGGQIRSGKTVNFCVPSGNFGNILAGYYAKQMGLPINKLICASNVNNVLTEFLCDGNYQAKREFFKTSSPSMDILISSNLERLVFELGDRNDKLTAERMSSLISSGSYDITAAELGKLKENFYASFCDDEDVANTIYNIFDDLGYILDPHTAVAVNVYDQYVAETDDNTPTVIISTASPYKFVESVLTALEEKLPNDEIKCLQKLEDITALPIPQSLINLPKMEKLYTGSIEKDDCLKLIAKFAGGGKK